ncbi:MAG: outer membrane beta-barrel family protein [Prevotellaceae bacterium]|nr:outer membrane beta-barrel family protein [Prevotellaceae bacterium]
MKAKIILLTLALIPYWGNAQQTQKISGKVFSETGHPVDGYNVILLSPKDSSIYKGDFFLDPDFSIETNQIPVLLKVTSFGYRDTTLLVQSAAQQLPAIHLSTLSYTLNEVVVKASQPIFSMRNDRITLNVAGTVLSESGTAVDVLQKAARVKVDENGISVLGIGNALIIVDGRELPNNQALEMLSSSEIQRMDIITSPSAKYDAKGKAVIEIRTKGVRNQGFGAEVTGRMSKGEYWSPYIGTEITAKTSKLSLYGFYAFSPNKKYNTESYVRDYTKDIPPSYGLIDMESVNKMTENHRIRLSGDYIFSDKHKAGLQLSGQFLDGNNAKNEISRIYNSTDTHTTPVSELSSVQQIPFTRNFLTGTAYYSHQSSPSGISLNSVFDKSRYDTDLDAQIQESGNSETFSKQNNIKTIIDIISFKTDVSIPLPKGYKLKTGLKYSNIHNQSNTFFLSEGVTIRSIDYEYKENTGALYFLLSNKFGKLNVELGARVEVSDNYAVTDVVVQDTTEWNIFPSLNLGYSLAKDWDINFSYAMKISRPTFQDLNPAIEYIDSLAYFQGNPGLVPEIRHALTLKLSYLKMMSLGFSYTRKNNLLAWYAEQDPVNPALTKLTQQNIDKSDVLSIDAMLPYQNKWVSCYLSTGLIYTISNDKASGVIDLKQPMWYAYSGFDFTLPYGLKVNTNIRYFTKGLENVFYFDPVFRMDAGVRRSFLNDKLTASILWNDIFKTDDMNTYTTINNRYIGYHYYFDRSVISFSLSFRFSSQKSKYQSRSSISSESQRIKGLD